MHELFKLGHARREGERHETMVCKLKNIGVEVGQRVTIMCVSV